MIIAFTGKMGSGKSTAINVIKQYVNSYVPLIKFADPLYDMQDYIYERISPVYTRPSDFVKDRKLLQWLGTEWGRDSISKSLWVDLWKNAVERSYAEVVLCDDVRFDNEAETVRAMGGKIVRLVAPDRNVVGTGSAGHSSESGISEHLVDATIINDGSIQDFREQVLTVFKVFGGGK